MKFNFCKNYDFPTEISIDTFEENLKTVKETKLLGIVVTDNLKWESNTDYLCKKAYKKLWILHRLKVIGVEPGFLLDVYLKEVRSILELAVPAWHSGLTARLSSDLERVQKAAVRIILGQSLPYSTALKKLNIDTLSVRRENLCERFARKTLKSKHADIFKPNNLSYMTRHKEPFIHPLCNTSRFYNSPVNYLTRILNNQ